MRKVKYTKLAIDDLNNSYDYIYKDSPTSAIKVIERIEIAIQKLVEFPELGKKGRVSGTYELYVVNTPFIIVYMVDDKFLKVISILHTSRKFP